MRKSNLLSGCVFAALAAILLWHAFADPNRAKEKMFASFGNWLDQHVFGDRALAERRDALLRFTKVHDELHEEYFAGRLTLEEAVDRIAAACQEHCPDFLATIARTEEGDSLQERIARCLARQVEEKEELRGNRELRERLQVELTELLKKRHKTQPPMVGAMAA